MKGRGRMAVIPNDISTPEQGLSLETRETTPTPAAAAAAELEAIKARITVARTVRPEPKAGELQCMDCFIRGRDTVIRVLTAPNTHADAGAELAALKASIEGARKLEPLPRDLHFREWFHRGRDAVIQTVLGD